MEDVRGSSGLRSGVGCSNFKIGRRGPFINVIAFSRPILKFDCPTYSGSGLKVQFTASVV